MSIICPFCKREFSGTKLNARHISICTPNKSAKLHPCLCGHESTSLTQMKRHRQKCKIWQERDVNGIRRGRMKATSLEKYGVEDGSHCPEIVAKRSATNLERYGAVNPFCKEASTFEVVQKALEGKRPVLKGADNPFAWPDVQEKIRSYWQQEYGVNGPQQVTEIRNRTKATNQQQYGGELRGSPILRERIEQTNIARYGCSEPSQNPEVKDRIQKTNLVRYGVPWTSMDPEVRRKQLETMEKHYGSHYFASEQGRAEIRAVFLERYGVEFPAQIEGCWEKALATFRSRYGVDHPLQLEYFRDKQRETNIARYGTPFPGLCTRGPNLLEQQVGKMAPTLLFTGDGTFWKRLSSLTCYKNPDFILPGPDPEHPHKDVTRVVEVFGDFWHSRIFTGKATFDHEQELIEAFAEIGIQCLVLWESEIYSQPQEIKERLQAFLTIS